MTDKNRQNKDLQEQLQQTGGRPSRDAEEYQRPSP